jgi:hypothetical protein
MRGIKPRSKYDVSADTTPPHLHLFHLKRIAGEYHAILKLKFKVIICIERKAHKKVITFHLRTLNLGWNRGLSTKIFVQISH